MKHLFCLLIGLPLMAAINRSHTDIEKKILAEAQVQWGAEAEIKVSDVFVREAVPAHAEVSDLFPHPAMGVVNFEVHWSDKDGEKTSMGSATVKVSAPVAVVAAPVERGEAIEKRHLKFEKRELSRLQQSGYFQTVEDVLGKVPKIGLRPGSVVGPNMIQDALAVSQGQLVELSHGTTAVTITARVKALENGRVGQWIRAENISSHRPLRVRVVAPGEVRLK